MTNRSAKRAPQKVLREFVGVPTLLQVQMSRSVLPKFKIIYVTTLTTQKD